MTRMSRSVTIRPGRPLAALLSALVLVAAGTTATSAAPSVDLAAPLPTATGDVVWSQEFDGATGTAPDTSVWNYDTGANGWGNAELQNYTTSRSNSALDGNGNLVITARQETDGSYTSARLQSSSKVELSYGRVEARIQIPRGQGIWPAFWMLGADFSDAGWPGSGEIDIMENVGKEPSLVHGTVHGPGYSGGSGITGTAAHPQGWSYADDFHTFAVDWKPGEITWYVDDVEYHKVTTADVGTNEWVFDKPFFLILNVAVGGSWPGNPDATTSFPQEMKVDWIRVLDNGATDEPDPGTGEATGTGPLRAGDSTLCLDVPWYQVQDGTPMQLATCNGGTAQDWTRSEDGTVRALGRCLDVAASGTANGTVVQLWTCNGTGAQKWSYDPSAGTLTNPQSGKCLDAVGGLPLRDGQRVQIWDCNGAANQHWTA
ncbi:glycoside hydrolase family 16 protein [Sanguibacter antarcticus]|uniref:Beta-glucanase (GH16 family) n=1 Tax=Sanguibacter antarcticus TaxID=372484 RepID=A0A2A9E4D1_9MICO|nr:glycoside hydrolase family 16 protein [Sanguibacter antarcticus]PFG33693.1 beta-glucanase (GH16 family) [Sanguibacter antarcticus]